MKKINVAIDGHSSTGKSTLAKQLAQALNYTYIDSGAMYRSVTLFAMQKNFFTNGKINTEQLVSLLPKIDIEFKLDKNGENQTYLNGTNVEDKIRGMEVSSMVSEVSKIKEVRKKLVELQQKNGAKKGVVMDGRDIGTVVFPDAELKIFMTADNEIRTQRRLDEMHSKGMKASFEQVAENLKQRDREDTNRPEAPLIKAADAIEINNSYLTKKEQFEKMLSLVKEKIEE